MVILGHIDHGKTSLLFSLKNLPFSGQKPEGKITQDIGAFEVEREGKKITFLDTPGHEAFSQMRTRGAKVADVAILVVSAIEGPKEQTKEAFSILKEAKIPFVVAINKIDLPGADPQKVKRELTKIGILVEEMGGEVPCVETSAKTSQGLNELLDIVLLLAEMKDLRVTLEGRAEGVIIESKLDPKRGPLASLILERGVLKIGDIIGTESALGRVKGIESPERKKLKELFPGQAGLILGLETVPRVGEILKVFGSLKEAQENLKEKKKEKESIFQKQIIQEKEEKSILHLILKADCLGSLEALEGVIGKIPQEKFSIEIVKKEVGLVTEEDIKLSKATQAFILAFRTKPDKIAQKILEREKIKIYSFEVIYDGVEIVRKLAKKLLEPEVERKIIGKLKVLVNFWREKNRQIIGGKVIEGKILPKVQIEVWRNEELIGRGRLLNLQKQRRDIEMAQKGEEVGILYEGDVKIKEEDVLVFFIEEKKKIEI